MGNNHEKYFGSDKRKVIILGLEKVGKTTFLQFVSKQKFNLNTEKTKNLNIEDVAIGNLNVSFFDLAGGERQRVFWKQQYEGTQGIIFMIDVTSSETDRNKSLQQLEKVIKQFEIDIPIAIGLTKIDQVHMIEWTKLMHQKYKDRQLKVFQIDYKNKENVKNILSWLLNLTKPI